MTILFSLINFSNHSSIKSKELQKLNVTYSQDENGDTIESFTLDITEYTNPNHKIHEILKADGNFNHTWLTPEPYDEEKE